MKDPDHGWVRAVNRTKNPSFGTPVGAKIDNFNQHPVPMHGRPDRVRRDKDVSRKPGFQGRTGRRNLWYHEPETLSMHCEPADHHVFVRSRLRNRISVRFNRQQLALGDQFLQPLVQFPPFVAVQAQLPDKLLVSSRLSGLALDLFQDGGIGEHVRRPALST
jgi:hypothetical protein